MATKVILEGHYKKFVQTASRNLKITRIPTLEELSSNGFDITDLFFLVLPNGLQVNPETINPDIFDDEIKGLFINIKQDTPAVVNNSPQDTRPCEVCQCNKPLEAYRKRPGRGNLRRSICMECEVKIKADTVNSITENLSKDQIQIVDGKTGYIKRYVAYDDVVKLVNEAFKRGQEEGSANVTTVTIPG